MKFSRLLLTLVISGVFNFSISRADTMINVPSSALSTGQPGEDPPGFSFTLEADAIVTVRAMFMTHWLTNRANVVSNPNSTRFSIDGKWYPSPDSPEDFYGYMDGQIWPQRVTMADQQIWIEETLSLSKGAHTIEFRNGLMERDDSRSRPIYSYADWMTASIRIPANVSRIVIPEPFVIPQPASASILPAAQSVIVGTTATLTLNNSGASRTDFSGGNLIAMVNPGSSVAVRSGAGTSIFNYVATGTARVFWTIIGADQIWIDPPNGAPIDVTSALGYTASQNGEYVMRAIAGGTTTSKSFLVVLPTTLATATLIVTADPGLAAGPRVTEFSPVAASFVFHSEGTEARTYGRSWQGDGGWNAYLGRDGVGLRVVGQNPEGTLGGFEIQAKPPLGEWYLLASGSPEAKMNTVGAEVPQSFSVMLGKVNQVKPLLPADPALKGKWTLRARVSSASGAWSPWAFEQSLNVIYPTVDVSVSGKTLPPIADRDWFTESPQATYTYQVLVP